MKRLVVVLMILGLVAGSVATAEAKRKNPRRDEYTVVGSYGPFPSPITGCSQPFDPYACLSVEPRLKDAFFTAKVMDAHGRPVFVEVRGGGRVIATFCGETSEPVHLTPYVSELNFYVALPGWPSKPAGAVLDCPGNNIKTTGTISVTLSNLP